MYQQRINDNRMMILSNVVLKISLLYLIQYMADNLNYDILSDDGFLGGIIIQFVWWIGIL